MSPVRLDPRAKLYLLVLSNLTLFFHIHLKAEVMLTALLLALFFLSGKIKTGVRRTALYGAMLAADRFLIPVARGFWMNLLALFSVGIRMMLPCIISGAYAFSTTTAGELVCALRRLHISETIVIPCVTVIRFFPTIAQDYRQIRSAMAFRAVAPGWGSLLRHPARSLEYILMPLLMNSTTVAQDLSIAAMTKGISLPGRHTSMVQLRMTGLDWGYMALCTAPFILFFTGVL